MKDYLKYIIVIVGFIACLLLAFFWGKKSQLFKVEEEESSQVMMDRISRVFKFVAVEGYVSEIYDYKQYRYWDVNFLRKQALVRVKAKVSVGYDFDQVEFVIDEEMKTITVKHVPDPEILSVDHDLDYYNLDEGLFNSFSADELTRVNKKAKEYVIEMIKDGEIFAEAEAQKEEIFEMLKTLVEQSDWKLVTNQEIRVTKG